MRGYFGLGQLSATEKSDILDQHKSLYNGYQTMQPQYSNTQPLTVYDFAGDKDGMVVNNKGEVKKYTNMGINEQVEEQEMCNECGGMMYEGECSECGFMEGEFKESKKLSKGQQYIAKQAKPYDKIGANDFSKLRSKKSEVKEKLYGKQSVLDKNKNKKITI